jgi:hypothetical protein
MACITCLFLAFTLIILSAVTFVPTLSYLRDGMFDVMAFFGACLIATSILQMCIPQFIPKIIPKKSKSVLSSISISVLADVSLYHPGPESPPSAQLLLGMYHTVLLDDMELRYLILS